jgi:hypothetical protein
MKCFLSEFHRIPNLKALLYRIWGSRTKLHTQNYEIRGLDCTVNANSIENGKIIVYFGKIYHKTNLAAFLNSQGTRYRNLKKFDALVGRVNTFIILHTK